MSALEGHCYCCGTPQCTSKIPAMHCTHAIQDGKALGTKFAHISWKIFFRFSGKILGEFSNYTLLQNTRWRRCGVVPPQAPFI